MKRLTIPLMLDSGAFSAYHQGVNIDLEEYIEFLHSRVKQSPSIVYVNLDVINDGAASYRNWEIMRESGLDPIPVYHVVTEIEWLKKYLEHTDHIAIGAIANLSSSKRTWALDRIWEDFLIDEGRMPTVKVHGMGITSFPLMARYPWHSVDSTSWVKLGAYGKIVVPKRKGGEWVYNEQPYVMALSDESPKMRDKGEHITTLTPEILKVLMEYLECIEMPLGVTEEVDGKREVIELGVTNNYRYRCFANALFYTRFMRELKWPRPFRHFRPRGLMG